MGRHRSIAGPHGAALRALPLLVLVALIASCGGGSGASATSTAAAPASGASFFGGVVTPAQPKPAFTLTDTEGHPFDFQRDTANTVTVLYFGYTHCPDVCPLNMAALGGGLYQAGPDVAGKVKVVFVTTDPARDDGPTLSAWLAHFGPDFVGLTGTDDQIAAAGKAAGLPPFEREPLAGGGYAVGHGAWMIVFGADNLAHLIYPSGFSAAQYAADLTKLVNQGWTGS